MARVGITREDVFLAISKIIAKNDSPTIEKIRDVLKTGSNSTISKWFGMWKSDNGFSKTQIYSQPSETMRIMLLKTFPNEHKELNRILNKIKKTTLKEIPYNEAKNILLDLCIICLEEQ